MKNYFVFLLGLMLILFSCGKNNDAGKLEKGTEAYNLAKAVSAVVPYFAPEENNVLIKTNKFVVTTGMVFKELQQNLGKRAVELTRMSPDQIKNIIKENARNFADKELLVMAAQEAGYSVDSAQVDSVFEAKAQRFGGKGKFRYVLESNGVDVNYVMDELGKGLMIERYLDDTLGKEAQVSEEEIKERYGEDKTATVRHILLSTQGKSDEEKQEIHKKMEEILEEARSGADFAELAKKYSQDPGSAKNGGLYKDFGRGVMVKPFEDAAFNTPVGEISDIIETRFGYHILKVEERKKETRPLAEVHDEIKDRILHQKKQEAYQALVDKLHQQAGWEEVSF